MTNGELFIVENPNIKYKLNGSCVWIYFDGVNHYTMPTLWWDQEISLVDKIRAEIDRQEKWLSQAGYTPYNTDIAFDAIRSALAERSDEEEEDDCTDIYCENCRNNYNCIEYLEEQERMNEEDDE